MNNVRASSADRIMLCNYSSINPDMKIDSSGPWSLFGQGGHSIMADIVKHDLTTMPDLSKVIEEFEIIDEKALRIGCHVGLKEYLNVIRPSIDRNHLITETKHSRPIGDKWNLTGHPDLACLLLDQTTLFVADWKFGDVSNHWHQLKSYAFILLQYFPQVDTVLLGQYFLRVNDKTVREFSREHIEGEWADSFIQALEGDSLHPSFHSCQYCPIIECTARDRLGRATVSSLSLINSNESTAIAMASRYEDVRLIERQIEKFKAHIKTELEITGQPIPVGDDKELTLVEGSRSTLYLHQALDVLKGYFRSEDTDALIEMLSDCVTIKKTVLMDLIGRKAAFRMKGKEKVRIEEEMDIAGAIKTKTHNKIILKKAER